MKNQIQDELKEVAPFLAAIDKEHPFKVPTNYFEDASKQLMSMVSVIDESENISDSTNHPFKTPENYFNQLPNAILEKIKANDSLSASAQPRIVKLMSYNKWWMAAASVVIILFISISVLRKPAVESISYATNTDTTFLLLDNAGSLSDAMLVDLYLENKTVGNSDYENSEVNYLIEASSLDSDYILSL